MRAAAALLATLTAATLAACGGSSASEPASAFMRALGRGDAAAACEQLTDDGAAQLAQDAGSDDCAQGLQARLTHASSDVRESLSSTSHEQPDVTASGDAATVSFGALAPFRMVRTGERWKIRSAPALSDLALGDTVEGCTGDYGTDCPTGSGL